MTERIRKHAVVSPFTVENGLLTPTQKIRRMLVIRANADVLARVARLIGNSACSAYGYCGIVPSQEHRQCYALPCVSGGVSGG